jgi:hypothetical protein
MPKPKLIKKQSKDQVIETLYEELERRDKQIQKLKEENLILVKTALKAAEKQKEAEEMINKKKIN